MIDKPSETLEYGRTVALRFAQFVRTRIEDRVLTLEHPRRFNSPPVDLEEEFWRFESEGNLEDL